MHQMSALSHLSGNARKPGSTAPGSLSDVGRVESFISTSEYATFNPFCPPCNHSFVIEKIMQVFIITL